MSYLMKEGNYYVMLLMLVLNENFAYAQKCAAGETKGCIPEPKDTLFDKGGTSTLETIGWILTFVSIGLGFYGLITAGKKVMDDQIPDAVRYLFGSIIVATPGAIFAAVNA